LPTTSLGEKVATGLQHLGRQFLPLLGSELLQARSPD